jgi:hypothetical protein
MMHYLLLFADAAAAADTSAPAWLREIAKPEVVVFLIPLAAICGGFATGIVKAVIKHRERMAKIEHGMDPDAPGNESRDRC